MTFQRAYTITKKVIVPGPVVKDPPLPRTCCMIVLSCIEDGTSREKLQQLCEYEVGRQVEIKLDTAKNDLTCIIDSLLKRMGKNSKAQFNIAFFPHSCFLPGETISFQLELIDFKNNFPLLFQLEPKDCMEISEEYKATGAALFKDSKTHVAAVFYSRAVKHLIIAHTLSVEENLLHERTKELLSDCYLNLAACLLRFDKYPEAIACCTDAMRYKKNSEKGLYRRAKGYLAINDYENAEKDILLGKKMYINNSGFDSLASKLKLKVTNANSLIASRLKNMFSS